MCHDFIQTQISFHKYIFTTEDKMEWKRPESMPFPNTWLTFTRTISGKEQTFWIQDYTDDYCDEVAYWVENGFMKEALLSKYAANESKATAAIMKKLFLAHLKNKISLVCLTKDPSDEEISLAGYNIMDRAVQGKNEGGTKIEFDSPVLEKFYHLLEMLSKTRDIFEELNITEYVDDFGLYVTPKYRGLKIGLEILRAREPLCKALGLRVTLTAFTSAVTQKYALACNFENFVSKSYKEIFAERPELELPGFTEHDQIFRYLYKIY